MSAPAPLLEVRRGGLLESVHFGIVVICDPAGHVVAATGDPHFVTFLRSTAKPFQALPVVESGAAAHYNIAPKELALICGSHSGTDEHAAMAAGLLNRLGLSEDDLQCGSHPPFDRDTSERLNRTGGKPSPLRHNCSGKHSGMLAHARHLGLSIHDYLESSHPVQQANRAALADLAGMDAAGIVVAVDGCSAPTFAMPMRNAARALARLMEFGSVAPEMRSHGDDKHAEACRAVVAAMTAYPEMVGGRGRFDTDVMRLGQGRLIAKAGAEGYEGVGIAPGALGPDSPALGLAVKILDGDLGGRAVKAVVIEALRQLGLIDDAAVAALATHAAGPIHNWRGLAVGETAGCFHLRAE